MAFIIEVNMNFNYGLKDTIADTESHWPHEHFGGCEIISFNHIVDATSKKCFYFLDDEDNKIYPGEQDSGHFFAWPPWRVHGADKVTEPKCE